MNRGRNIISDPDVSKKRLSSCVDIGQQELTPRTDRQRSSKDWNCCRRHPSCWWRCFQRRSSWLSRLIPGRLRCHRRRSPAPLCRATTADCTASNAAVRRQHWRQSQRSLTPSQRQKCIHYSTTTNAHHIVVVVSHSQQRISAANRTHLDATSTRTRKHNNCRHVPVVDYNATW